MEVVEHLQGQLDSLAKRVNSVEIQQAQLEQAQTFILDTQKKTAKNLNQLSVDMRQLTHNVDRVHEEVERMNAKKAKSHKFWADLVLRYGGWALALGVGALIWFGKNHHLFNG